MKRRKMLVVLGAMGLLGIICLAATGALIYWAVNDPKISEALGNLTSSLSNMADLQKELSASYPADDIRVGVTNGHILTVSLTNSDANKLSESDQKARAKEIAVFAKNHYADIGSVDTIEVTFIQEGGAFGISMKFTRNYAFKLSDLP